MVHGISPDQTKDHPTFPEIWDKIKHYLADQLVIAHNVSFDRTCLIQALKLYGIEEPSLTWACTYEATGLSLIDLVEALEITALAHHDALNDAHMCAEAYIKLQMGIVPDTNKITPKPAKPLFDGHTQLSGDVLRPNLQNANPSSPFYAKKVVFTGVLTHISREDAAEKVKLLGADIDTGITPRTDLVIVGKGAGPVKLKKIEAYNGVGADIRIVNEREFLGMIGFKVV